MYRRVGDKILWSGCPSAYTVEQAFKDGVRLIINLTERGECDYPIPEGIEYINYEIPDFSFSPVEDVYYKVIMPAVEKLRGCDKILVHCRGGVGRSGTTIAMILQVYEKLDPIKALREVEYRGGGPQTPVQDLAYRWFSRIYGLLGDNIAVLYRDGERFGFGWGIDHASTVANISLDILEAVSSIARTSRQAYKDAYVAGLLHDIGRVHGSFDHNVSGSRMVYELESVKRIARADVVAKAIYHHRRSTDFFGDEELAGMGEEAQVVVAAVRAADAIKNAYFEDGLYYGLELEGDELVVKGSMFLEIMFKDFIEKSEPLRRLLGVNVVFRKSYYI